MNGTTFVIVIVAGALVYAAALTFGILAFIRFLSNRPGGFGSLAAAYPETGSAPEPTLTRQTSKIGIVSYKGMVNMTIGRDSLHIRICGKAAKIPWSEIKAVGETKFRWQKWPVLHIGDPRVASIVVSPEAYQAMKIRLKLGEQRGGNRVQGV